ncbi:hypothetical protein LA080_014633 [Diaporthe eres]|nr:hypothetical protein LA080_014633 [Diaporthe eres]
MQLFTTLAAALAASTTVSASATAPATTCATPTATVTEVVPLFCRRYACPSPSRSCRHGEPTQPEALPPVVLGTVTPEPGACTVVAEAILNPGCNQCPTCLPGVLEHTHTAPLATQTFTA